MANDLADDPNWDTPGRIEDQTGLARPLEAIVARDNEIAALKQRVAELEAGYRMLDQINDHYEQHMLSLGDRYEKLEVENNELRKLLKEGVDDEPCPDFEPDCYNCRAWKALTDG